MISRKTVGWTGGMLAVLMCWAMGSSQAGPAGVSPADSPAPGGALSAGESGDVPLPGQAKENPVLHEDAGYLGLFGVARLDDVYPAFQAEAPRPVREHPIIRWIPADQVRFAPDDEGPGTRGDGPCNNIAYRNQPGSIVGTTAINLGLADDCILATSVDDTFICSATVQTLSAAAVGGPTYDVTVEVWDNCPENPGSVMVARGTFANIPNDGLFRSHTIDVSPDFRDPDRTIWVLMQSNNPDAAGVIAGNTVDVGDIGSTANTFTLSDGIAGCDFFVFTGGTTFGGMTITLRGTQGPLGSCCNTLAGVCTPSLAGDCTNFTQVWSPLNCASAPPCNLCAVASCNPTGLENEPDCTTNYVDVTNRGCSNRLTFNPATEWTPVTAPATGCGRSGTYSFLNGTIVESRVDSDQYLLVLTQDTRVTWKVRGTFPTLAAVTFTLRQTNLAGPLSCGLNVTGAANDTSIATATACNDAVATACLPGRPQGFRYLLLAQPQINSGIPCGSSYQWEVTTAPCSFPTNGACCTPTGCIQSSPLGCLIGFNQYQGDGTTCGTLNPPCVGVPSNDTCAASKIVFSNTVDVTVAFDTTFASTEPITYAQSGSIFKDVWYEYRVPSIGSATTGRLAVSTIGTCFNSKVALLDVRNLAQPDQAIQCSSTGVQSAQLRGFGTPVIVTLGTPAIPIAGFTYVRSNTNLVTGRKIKIRVGGINDSEFGPGMLRVSWIPDDSAGSPWNLNAGRCCLPGGGCVVAPFPSGWSGPPSAPPDTTPDNCAELGGYLTFVTDFQEGNAGADNPEFQAVGCASLPCPVAGEACWNALDLNAILGGGFGTTTRFMRNTLHYKYTVPMSTPVGSAIVINTCGSIDFAGVNLMDTAMAIYRGFNAITGVCDGLGNTLLYSNDNCGPNDVTAAAAADRVSCYAGGGESCGCLEVVSGTPGFRQVRPGDTIYILIGASNNLGGDRLLLDPERNPCDLAALQSDDPVFLVTQVTNPASCFVCSQPSCSGTSEGEGTCGVNYVDNYNAGCGALVPSNQLFLPITCGQTYCGQCSTYRTNPPCLDQNDCGFGDTCTPPTGGICLDDTDNTRDIDFYRVVVTSPSRLTWNVQAVFPAALQIVSSPNATSTLLGDPSDADSCVDTVIVAQQVNLEQCDTTIAEADVCPGVYYLMVAPSNTSGVPCDRPRTYSARLTCSTPSALANACCKGDLNNDGRINGTDVQLWINELRLPQTTVQTVGGCFDLLTCRADFTNDYQVTQADLAGFVGSLVGKPACPATVCEDSAACHVLSGDDVGVISDMSSAFGGSFRSVDDFKVTSPGASQSLQQICWWGFYFDFNNVVACVPSGGTGDNFKISIYNDASGLPGTKAAATFSGLTVTKTDTGVDLNYFNRKVRRFKYQTTLPSPVNVAGNGCYWIEIVNQTSGACLWLWETSRSGNGVSAQRNGGPAGKENWSQIDLAIEDFAFCLPGLRISNTDCGLPLGRCCVYPAATCSITTQDQCTQVLHGTWTSGITTCAGGCPFRPPNDSCANAQLITANALYTGTTFNATKDADSPPMACEQTCAGLCNTANDVWFRWENNDPGFGGPLVKFSFSMCDGEAPTFRYDSMMLVYDNCPSLGGQLELGGCNDDGCGGFSGPSRVVLDNQPVGSPPFCTPNVDCYKTYWIRVSGYGGTNGNFTLKVFKP